MSRADWYEPPDLAHCPDCCRCDDPPGCTQEDEHELCGKHARLERDRQAEDWRE